MEVEDETGWTLDLSAFPTEYCTVFLEFLYYLVPHQMTDIARICGVP